MNTPYFASILLEESGFTAPLSTTKLELTVTILSDVEGLATGYTRFNIRVAGGTWAAMPIGQPFVLEKVDLANIEVGYNNIIARVAVIGHSE